MLVHKMALGFQGWCRLNLENLRRLGLHAFLSDDEFNGLAEIPRSLHEKRATGTELISLKD
jgi:hypothetical protein